MKKINNLNLIFFLLSVFINPLVLIKVFEIKIIIDSYLLSILSGLISILFILIVLGNNIKFRKYIKIIFIPFSVIFVLFIFFSIFEIYCKAILSRSHKYSSKMTQNFELLFEEDSFSGYKLTSNFKDSVGKIAKNDTIYYANYETDSFHRRKVNGNSKKDNNHLILFGCSYTFGDGIDNKNTFAQILKDSLKSEYSVYNYGVPGYGTQQMLTTIQYQNLNKEIPQKKGTVLYIYVPGIISRNIAAFSTFNWSKNYPCYKFEKAKLKYYSSAREAYPNRTRVFDFLHNFNTFRYLNFVRNFNYPKVNDEYIELTGKILAESRKSYLKYFPDSRFATIIFPHLHNKDPNTEKLIENLKNKNIPVFDLSNFADTITDKTIKNDGHPSAYLHKAISNYIFSEIF